MIAAVIITAAIATSAPVEAESADIDFRRAATQTCPEILEHGRSFFMDDARLSAAGLTVSPLVRALIDKPGFPVGASGEHVVITLADNVGLRENGDACTVSALPRTNADAIRNRFFASFNPTAKQTKDLQRNKIVGFFTGKTDTGLTHLIAFWRLGVYVEKVKQ